MANSNLFLIDAHALCYRSFFAIRGLSTSYGQATNAVYGFVNTLKKIMKDYNPEHLAICFDVGKKTLRQERFADYKIHRPAMPDELISQIPLIKEVAKAYRFPIYELEGFEADDVIASIAEKMKSQPLDIYIISGDKDMVQLVDERIKILDPRKGVILGKEEVRAKYGFDPMHIIDFIALAGDKTDNIPGVNGIGEVTAKKLICQYGSLENIYAHLEGIKSKSLQEKLRKGKEDAFFSKELATLDRDIPLEFSLDRLKVNSPDYKKLFALFQRLEFKKLAEEVALHADFSPDASKATTVIRLKTENEVKQIFEDVRKTKTLAFHVEEISENDSLFSFLWIYEGQKTYQIDTHKAEKAKKLKTLFEDEDIIKVCHNVKDAFRRLEGLGISLRGPLFDVSLAAYLLSPARANYDLVTLAWQFLKETVSGETGGDKVEILYSLYPVLEKELKEKALFELFQNIEMPLAYVLYIMESHGVKIDGGFLNKMSKQCDAEINKLVKMIFNKAGSEFNLNSPKQLARILFDVLKLPVVKKTKTGFSTDEGVLTKLALQHPVPALLLEYRQLTKLKSTYIDALPKLINSKTGRIHATFVQTGTETGRLSSKNPNLQNIPIRTELGRKIRKAFVPTDNHYVIISADYSQIELRILAHLSQDKRLKEAFIKDEDIHRFTASQIFDVPEKKVTSQMRNSAKRVNFGIIYGMSAYGLAKDLNISPQEAQAFIDRYFSRYPGVKAFMEEQIKMAEKQGFVLTILNRRRYLPEITSDNMAVRQFAQRQAINTPVQGSAADLIKLAMINIQKEIDERNLKTKMIITVHDELVFDAFKEEEKLVIDLVRHLMETPLKLDIPIKVAIKVGPNWLETKER